MSADSGKLIGKYRVVIASPNDVLPERDIVHSAIKKVNNHLKSMGKQYQLDPREQRDARPKAGNPNKAVDGQLEIEKSDIFIGIFWYRFGSETGNVRPEDGTRYISGTEEEIDLAFRARAKNPNRRPDIMLYRKTDPLPQDWKDDDHRQYVKLLNFLDECGPNGKHPAYVADFTSDKLEELLIDHLLRVSRELEEQDQAPSSQISLVDKSLLTWFDQVGLHDNPFIVTGGEDQYSEDFLVSFSNFSPLQIRQLREHPDPAYIFGARGSGKTTLLTYLINPEQSPIHKRKTFGLKLGAYHFERILHNFPAGIRDYHFNHFTDSIIDAVNRELSRKYPEKNVQARRTVSISPVDLLAELLDKLDHVDGFTHFLCAVDELDEINLIKASAQKDEDIFALLKQMVLLPRVENLLVRYFLPARLELMMQREAGYFRLDRYPRYHLSWSEDRLIELLSRRITAFSKTRGAISSLSELYDSSQSNEPIDIEIARLSEGNPRALLWIASHLIELHCKQKSPPLFIQRETWETVKFDWQRERSNFLEVEPTRDFWIKNGTPLFRKQEIVLTNIPARLLICLIEANGEICDRDTLVRAGWETNDPQFTTDKAFYEQMSRVNEGLADIAPGWLENVRGKGYRLRKPDTRTGNPSTDQSEGSADEGGTK